MITYLITFTNVFEHANFRENIEQYFDYPDWTKVIKYSSKFCIVETKRIDQFHRRELKQNFPGVLILLKQHFDKRIKYTKL